MFYLLAIESSWKSFIIIALLSLANGAIDLYRWRKSRQIHKLPPIS